MWGIAELTFRKIKESAFMMIFVLAIVAGFILTDSGKLSESTFESSGIVGQLLASRNGYPIMTSTFSAIIFTLIMALFTGATEIPRDIENRMVMLLLSKPISKTQYLLGKYFGLLSLCMIIFVTTEITVYLGHYFTAGEFYPFGMMLKQFYLILLLFPFLAMMVMISCFVPDVSAMILGVLYILFSVSMSTVPILLSMLPESLAGDAEATIFLLYYLFPNFLYYFQTFNTVGLVPLALVIYSLSMTVIFLTIGVFRMSTRDMIS